MSFANADYQHRKKSYKNGYQSILNNLFWKRQTVMFRPSGNDSEDWKLLKYLNIRCNYLRRCNMRCYASDFQLLDAHFPKTAARGYQVINSDSVPYAFLRLCSAQLDDKTETKCSLKIVCVFDSTVGMRNVLSRSRAFALDWKIPASVASTSSSSV